MTGSEALSPTPVIGPEVCTSNPAPVAEALPPTPKPVTGAEVCTCTPSAVKAAATMEDASASSVGSTRSAASNRRTSTPSRARAWASSHPVGPPPTIPSETGRDSNSNKVSVVSTAPPANPPTPGGPPESASSGPTAKPTESARPILSVGPPESARSGPFAGLPESGPVGPLVPARPSMGGMAGREPAAITIRGAVTRRSSTATVSWVISRARPSRTATPRWRHTSADSVAAMRSTTARTRSMASPKPSPAAAAAIRVLEGTHPVKVQSPPMGPSVTRATSAPAHSPVRTAASPAAPPPTTMRS